MASYTVRNPGALSDAQARTLVIRALRRTRAAQRASDSTGERFERELDRLIKRKKRINAGSLDTLVQLYRAYNVATEGVMAPLTDTINAANQF